MRNGTGLCAAALLLAAPAAWGQQSGEPGLVGYWSFDDTTDNQTADLSGRGSPGRVVGALGVKRGAGNALRFDGVDDHVDCGAGQALNFTKAISVSVWVCPDSRPKGEPGIVMRSAPEVWGLTYYHDGRCWWYVSSGGNSIKAGLGVGTWHHVVGTYDGKVSKLYIDGKLRGTKEFAVPVKQEGKLLIGMREKSRDAFRGLIDEVRIYDRALTAKEVSAQFKAEATEMTVRREPVEALRTLRGEGYELRVGRRGGMQVDVDGESYVLESSFSHPGERIGHNRLTEDATLKGESAWRAEVSPVSDDGRVCRVSATGAHYSLARTVRLAGHRIEISDALTNIGSEPVGVLVSHDIITEQPAPEFVLCGVPGSGGSAAEHPTVLVRQEATQLGAAAEDSLSRTQFQASAATNKAGFGLRHLGIAPGKSVTLECAYYPFGRGADYWTFVNRLREDWGVNFTLIGPGDMFNVTWPQHWGTFTDRDRCAAYLKRNRLKVLSLAPWIDYDNHDSRTGKLTTRQEYKKIVAKVKATVKSVDPQVKIIGDIEAPFVSLPRPLVEKIYNSLPEGKRKGYHEFTDAQTRMLKSNPKAWGRWHDSAVITRDGRMKFESYKRGKWPMIALTVRPVLGNGQHEYLMEQAKFVIEECGLDGFYVDSFTGSKHWHYGYGYDKWDGVTVDIDAATGRITSKYTDLALAGTESRRVFMQYGLDKGGVVVTNGHPIARETQSMPVMRFNESEWVINIYNTPLGERPPLHGRPCKAQLASPLALGVRPHRYGEEKAKAEYATIIMRTAIHYLRHGVLYFHYGSEIPSAGPGCGEYGPINHMFPITPVRLGEGFVAGKERIVTAVSRVFDWPGAREPKVLLFDITGRPKSHDIKPRRSGAGWQVPIRMADWSEIAVVEPAE